MGSPEEKAKHSKRLRKKRQEKVRSNIAKDLLVSGKYKQRIVKDKRGKKYDLRKMSHHDLVKAIQEIEDYGDE
jgi:hypothetical protein